MRPHFHSIRFATLAALLAVVLGLTASSARAQSQTDLVTPTAWWWQTNVTLQDINDRIAQGYRIVDIEVEDDSPLRFSAAFVRNSGVYAKGWWWYYGQTEAQVNSRFSCEMSLRIVRLCWFSRTNFAAANSNGLAGRTP